MTLIWVYKYGFLHYGFLVSEHTLVVNFSMSLILLPFFKFFGFLLFFITVSCGIILLLMLVKSTQIYFDKSLFSISFLRCFGFYKPPPIIKLHILCYIYMLFYIAFASVQIYNVSPSVRILVHQQGTMKVSMQHSLRKLPLSSM